MDPNQSEYAPRWLVGYYHLERKGIDRSYHYHTSIVTITDLLLGLRQRLETFHKAKCTLVSIVPLQGFRWEPFTGKNVYVDFKAIAKKCIEDEAVLMAQRVNAKFMDDIKNVLSDHGECVDLSTLNEIERVTKAVVAHTGKSTKFLSLLERNLQGMWEQNLLPKIHRRFFSKTGLT